MYKRLLWMVPVALATTACSIVPARGTSSPRASAADTNGQVTIPDVFKLPKDRAIAELRRAGVQGDIVEDSSLCGSIVDGRIVERGEVCYQHPPAGRVHGARLGVSLRVQSEDPRHGNVGKHTEWRLMPNLVGLTFDQARAEMKRAGFLREDRFEHIWADEESCKPGVVCRQYPNATERVGINDGKTVYVGKEPRSTPVLASVEPTRVEPARPEASKPSPLEPSSPATASASGTASPTASSTPPPTASSSTPPPTTSPPSSATSSPSRTEPKLWGGDGTPAYRDSANRPRGPGGSVFMGKGPPCTDQLDHCLRPGVWFATDNVVAGRLFRGVPVFELEAKWWTWRGQPAEYKFLFRTKLVAKPSELEVGKPVLWFVEDGPKRRWLDNEYDMLTSSRWSIGVIDAVASDSIRVKGWDGSISFDTVRVIVETKEALSPSASQTPPPPPQPKPPTPGDLF